MKIIVPDYCTRLRFYLNSALRISKNNIEKATKYLIENIGQNENDEKEKENQEIKLMEYKKLKIKELECNDLKLKCEKYESLENELKEEINRLKEENNRLKSQNTNIQEIMIDLQVNEN